MKKVEKYLKGLGQESLKYKRRRIIKKGKQYYELELAKFSLQIGWRTVNNTFKFLQYSKSTARKSPRNSRRNYDISKTLQKLFKIIL